MVVGVWAAEMGVLQGLLQVMGAEVIRQPQGELNQGQHHPHPHPHLRRLRSPHRGIPIAGQSTV